MVEKSQLCFFFGFLLFKKVFIEELRGRREERKTNFKVLFRRSRAFKIQKFSRDTSIIYTVSLSPNLPIYKASNLECLKLRYYHCHEKDG